MGIDLMNTQYSNLHEIPYLNGGIDVSSEYVSDINKLEQNVKKIPDKGTKIQTILIDYYKNGYHEHNELDGLEKYIANAFIENENLSKDELKNNINYAIKTENLHKNITNSKLYNSALHEMVSEDISLNEIGIEKMKDAMHNAARNLEIRQYYDKKMSLQTTFIKKWIIMCLILLSITFLYKLNLLSTHIYILLIGVGLACIFIYVIASLIEILVRDNFNFDEYAYMRSHHYLNKGEGDAYKTFDDDIPLHQQEDLISNKCLHEYNKKKAT